MRDHRMQKALVVDTCLVSRKGDAQNQYKQPGDPYDKKVAARLRKYGIDPAEGFRLFRGRGPKADALFVERGFPVTK